MGGSWNDEHRHRLILYPPMMWFLECVEKFLKFPGKDQSLSFNWELKSTQYGIQTRNWLTLSNYILKLYLYNLLSIPKVDQLCCLSFKRIRAYVGVCRWVLVWWLWYGRNHPSDGLDVRIFVFVPCLCRLCPLPTLNPRLFTRSSLLLFIYLFFIPFSLFAWINKLIFTFISHRCLSKQQT